MKDQICQICNFSCKSLYGLSRHVQRKHNIGAKEYYDKFLKQEKDGLCKVCQKETRFNGLSYGYSIYCRQSCTWSDEQVKNKRINTNLQKYGETCIHKTKQFKKKISINSKLNWKKQYSNRLSQKVPFLARVGIDETKCLNEIESKLNIVIKRNPFLFGYFVDGYIETHQLIIEFDEDHHFKNGILSENDQKRQKDLEIRNYQFFRIKKNVWLDNKEDVLNRLKTLMGEKECVV